VAAARCRCSRCYSSRTRAAGSSSVRTTASSRAYICSHGR
jgi:hypothetical protein